MQLNEKTEDEAAYWVARRMSGEMTAAQMQAFRDWLVADDAHRAAFEEQASAAAALDEVGDEILAREFESELETLAELQSPPRRRIAAAAALAVVMASGVFAFTLSGRDGADLQQFATATGERSEQALSDGSHVQLNTRTDLEIAYSKSLRRARMDRGEALFTVERDTRRPFIVSTIQGEIVVTGTTFNVFADMEGTVVSVVSGAVDVSPSNGPRVTLLAGQSIAVDAKGQGGAIDTFDPNRSLAWRDGKARFVNEPLSDVIDDLNRYFARPISLGDPELASLPVTGEFDIDDQQTAIAALSIAFSLKQTPEAARIVLSKMDAS